MELIIDTTVQSARWAIIQQTLSGCLASIALTCSSLFSAANSTRRAGFSVSQPKGDSVQTTALYFQRPYHFNPLTPTVAMRVQL